MRLRYDPLDLELPLQEGKATVLSVEAPKMLSDMLIELSKAMNGEQSEWHLSNEDSEQKLAKNLEVLWNPLFVDLNEKKLLNSLYKELEGFVTDDLFSEYSSLNADAVSFLDHLTGMVPYPLTFELDVSVSGLLKLYQLTFEDDADNPVEKLIDYLRLSHQIKKVSYFLILNLKQFYSDAELRELYKFAEYEHIQLFVLEGYHSRAFPNENNWILDKDLCLIRTKNKRITATVRGKTR